MQKPGVTLETLDAMSSVMDRFQETDAEMLPVLDGEGIFCWFPHLKPRLYSLYRKLNEKTFQKNNYDEKKRYA